jgi:hypothetical protein
MVSHALRASVVGAHKKTRKNQLYLDSAATEHMVNRAELLTNLVPVKGKEVLVANGEYLPVVAKGTLILQTRPDFIAEVHDVLLVPGLHCNLFSVRRISSRGYNLCFRQDLCEIVGPETTSERPYLARARISTDNQLYEVEGEIHTHGDPVAMALAARSSFVPKFLEEARRWHNICGHTHWDRLRQMQQQGLVVGLPEGISDLPSIGECLFCLAGKTTRKPFDGIPPRLTSPGEALFLDLIGPFTASIRGSKFALVAVDDASRYKWVFPIKRKSKAAQAFWFLQRWISNQLRRYVRSVRVDGGELGSSKEFVDQLKSHGIVMTTTPRHTPELNGTVERANCSLKDMMRTLLLQANLPEHFWAEALTTACYTQNRLPHSSNPGHATPYSMVFGHSPDISNMHVFGCLAMVHIPKSVRGTLEPVAETCVFMGYDDPSVFRHVYRIYSKTNHAIYRTRDVKFFDNIRGINAVQPFIVAPPTNAQFVVLEDSAIPAAPAVPAAPAAPDVPAAPAAPVVLPAPAAPVVLPAPVAPVAPALPVVPATPAAPAPPVANVPVLVHPAINLPAAPANAAINDLHDPALPDANGVAHPEDDLENHATANLNDGAPNVPALVEPVRLLVKPALAPMHPADAVHPMPFEEYLPAAAAPPPPLLSSPDPVSEFFNFQGSSEFLVATPPLLGSGLTTPPARHRCHPTHHLVRDPPPTRTPGRLYRTGDTALPVSAGLILSRTSPSRTTPRPAQPPSLNISEVRPRPPTTATVFSSALPACRLRPLRTSVHRSCPLPPRSLPVEVPVARGLGRPSPFFQANKFSKIFSSLPLCKRTRCQLASLAARAISPHPHLATCRVPKPVPPVVVTVFAILLMLPFLRLPSLKGRIGVHMTPIVGKL